MRYVVIRFGQLEYQINFVTRAQNREKIAFGWNQSYTLFQRCSLILCFVDIILSVSLLC